MKAIQDKLSDIIEATIKNKCSEDSLLSGHNGIAVFLAYVKELSYIAEVDFAFERAIQKSLGLFDKDHFSHSFSDGIAGICWGVSHLAQQSKIETNLDMIFEDIDPYLMGTSERDLKINNFDFLHGGLGAGIYFFDRLPDVNAKNQIANSIQLLYQNAEISDNDIIWSNLHFKVNNKLEKVEYNLGLSHGIPSIIWFLSKCYENNIEKEKCEYLLSGSVNWLMKQKNKRQSISLYPTAIVDSIPIMNSRLAWCYGDLGIAIGIWQAGKSLKNEKWKNEAITIMLHASFRKDLSENGVIDAGICHGTAGIAHVFNRFYWETKRPVFKETANYWVNETLKMAYHEDGLAGFKFWSHEKGWLNKYGLLEGIAGIGLVLLNHITNEEPTWDRCLLLS